MKKKLAMALLGLTTMFVLGTSSLALATTVDSAVSATLAPVTTDMANDNGILNANKTGLNVSDNTGASVNDVIKSDGMNYKVNADGTTAANSGVDGQTTQRTHGEYQNNTNSCASCHQTHTGAADNLLFKSGVYETCTACHDGTLGFYNVFTPSTAGTFGGTSAGNASVHMANGSMQVKAAPGGNKDVVGSGKDGLGEETWNGEFTCASCHQPHGSYSDRLLHFNPNGIASVPMKDDATGSYTGTANGPTGGQMVRDVVVAALPTADATSPDYVVLQTTAGAVPELATVIANTNYGVAGTDAVVVVMKKTSTNGVYSYVKDTAPWINGGEYKEDHSFKVAFTKFYSGAVLTTDTVQPNTQITTGVTFFPQQGFAKLSATMKDGLKPTATTYTTLVGTNADISRAFVIKLKMDPVAYDWFGAANSGVKITQVSPANYSDPGQGVAISTFCASCHTDYLTASSDEVKDGGTGPTGVWSKAFRHSTNSDTYTCLKCHFAHGTDVSVMMDAQDRGVAKAATDLFAGDTAKATAYLVDKNADSALKRYTNMSVCWKCHTSSHNVGLVNNDYVYNTQYDADTTNNTTLGKGFVAPANSALPYFKAQADIVTP